VTRDFDSLRLVLDTNVLVSALLHPGRVPDQLIERVRTRGHLVLYDERVAHEYATVLARPKFRAIAPARTEALLAALLGAGERVTVTAPFEGAMTDPDDRVFVEVALAGGADVLVTGNTRHYPLDLGFEVLPPAALLARFGDP
jgi:putative PIN family toxin of toxin-antitoxin system